MLTLADIKQNLRISHNLDDDYISNLIELSKDVIERETGVEYNSNNKVFEHAITLMVNHFYYNRTAVSDKAMVNVPFSLQHFINLLGMSAYDN